MKNKNSGFNLKEERNINLERDPENDMLVCSTCGPGRVQSCKIEQVQLNQLSKMTGEARSFDSMCTEKVLPFHES